MSFSDLLGYHYLFKQLNVSVEELSADSYYVGGLNFNMLVLRTSNFQGASIRPIVQRNKHYCFYKVGFFRVPVQTSYKIILNSSSRESQM